MSGTAPPAEGHAGHVHWLRLGMQIRLALHPDDPRLLAQYLAAGTSLAARQVHTPWHANERMLNLLLDTAYDVFLPIVWRLNCLDACCRPMAALGPLVCDDDTAIRLRLLAHRLASFSYNPESAS